MMRMPWTFLILVLLSNCAYADFVIFKNGHQIEGEVLQEDEESLLLKVDYGTMKIEKSKVLTIRKETEAEIAQRKQAAEEKKMFEERMLRQGRVLYKGKWIDADEKKRILASIEKKKLLKEEARKKAELAKKKAEKEEQKRREKFLKEQEKLIKLDPRERRLQRRQDFRDKYSDRDRRSNNRNNNVNRGSNNRNNNVNRGSTNNRYEEGSNRR